MLSLVTSEKEIRKAQHLLSQTITSSADKHGEISVGGKGWNQRARLVYWNAIYDFWWTTREETDRYWNSFGLGEPRWDSKYSHNIVVEINYPKEGKNNRLSGLIAVDGERTYLMQRGRIGGGRKGIGKTLFCDNFTGEWQDVWDGDNFSKVAYVGLFKSPKFLAQLAAFVKDVSRIKDNRIEKLLPKNMPLEIFSNEFQGTKRYHMPDTLEQQCNHGLVISALRAELTNKGLKVGNRGRIDLYTLGKDKEITTLYEAKTDDSINSCCHAIGQLLYYSRRLKISPRLVAVLPDTITSETRNIFRDLQIDVLTYNWKNNQPNFKESW